MTRNSWRRTAFASISGLSLTQAPRSFHQIVVGPDRRRGKSQDGGDHAGNGIAHSDRGIPFRALPAETFVRLKWMTCIRR